MFTGIIEKVGQVVKVETQGTSRRLVLESAWNDLVCGESIATNGICLTVASVNEGGRFVVDLSHETLRRSTACHWTAGTPLNLERSLLPTSRMGGHWVTGHVDGVAKVERIEATGSNVDLIIKVDPSSSVAGYHLVAKGSVAVDGISLTVNGWDGTRLKLTIVPHTWAHTNLRSLTEGDAVNIETDILAKHLEAMVSRYLRGALAQRRESAAVPELQLVDAGDGISSGFGEGISREFLKTYGWLDDSLDD